MSNPSTGPSTTFDVPQPSQPNGSHGCSNFVHRLLISLVFLLVSISVTTSVAWSIIHPIPPIFTLNSLSISNFTLSEQRVKAHYDVELFIKNRSKKATLVIDEFCLSNLYQKSLISETFCTEPEPVFLNKMGYQSLRIRFPRNSLDHVVKRRVFNNINEDWSKKELNLNTKMSIRTTFRYGFWPPKEAHMNILCNDLKVEFFSAKGSTGSAAAGKGKLRGGAKFCFTL